MTEQVHLHDELLRAALSCLLRTDTGYRYPWAQQTSRDGGGGGVWQCCCQHYFNLKALNTVLDKIRIESVQLFLIYAVAPRCS